MPRRRTDDRTAPREPGQRRLPSGKWQVFVRIRRPGETRSRFLSTTFPADSLITDRRNWRECVRVEARTGQALTPFDDTTFAEDAARYLESVAALPTIAQRRQHINEWVVPFGHRPRTSIRPHEIRAQRDRWLTEPRTDQQGRTRPPYAPSSVNHRLRALSNLWRVLDGRHTPNPVREVPEAEEEEDAPRALPYAVIEAILDAMPDHTRLVKSHRVESGSRTKARLAVMAWTGLAHSQLMRLRPEDVDWTGQSIWVRGRRKGLSGKERKGQRKPITDEAITALRRFAALDCWGTFSKDSMRKSLRVACRKVEEQCKANGVELDLSRVRPYDFRHSYATAILAATSDLRTTQRLMLHSSARTTERYARGRGRSRPRRRPRAVQRSRAWGEVAMVSLSRRGRWGHQARLAAGGVQLDRTDAAPGDVP